MAFSALRGRVSLWRSFQCYGGFIKRQGLTTTQRYAHGGKQSTASVPAGPVYELRIYNIRPDKFFTFRELLAEKFHLRLAYSKPLGFWIADIGGIFQAVNIWRYESLSHREETHQTMLQDKIWVQELFVKVLQCADKLDNSVMVLSPGTSLCTDFPPSPTAAYELLTLTRQGQGQSLAALPLSHRETLVGSFRTVYGDINTEYHLMRYADADTAFTHARTRLEKNPEAIGYSRFMVPHDCSPIK